MIKKLNIFIDKQYFNDCWSFEYFCIIDSNPNYRNWKFFNYNFITTNYDNDLVYGFNGAIYDFQSKFKEVLNITHYQYFEVKTNRIIQFIKESLNNDNYIILMLLSKDNNMYHEILIYGYDDEKKVFYSPVYFNKTIKEKEITFKNIEQSYKHTILNINIVYERHTYKFDYFSPISQLVLRKNISLNDININSLYMLLKRTLNNCNVSGKIYYLQNFKSTFYNGLLGVVNAILKEFDLYKYKNKRTYNFEKNIKSFITYRKMFYDAIVMYKNNFKLKIPLYDKLEDTFNNLENCMLILIKANFKYNNSTIIDIRTKMIDIFRKDYQYVNELCNTIEKSFMNLIR